MKLSALIDGIEGSDVEISGLTSDSRAVGPGCLFAGLPGVVVDGAKFIDQAVAGGASAILTHYGFKGQVPDHIPLIQKDDPRLALALMAAKFYAPQPAYYYGVTGTNGKTSVASFVRQIWQGLGIEGASLGTVGVVSPLGVTKLAHTTPEPVQLHKLLNELAVGGINHVVIEASSHGLAQRRLDGLRFDAAAFTNITRDHLDYHGTFDAYFAEKKRLFSHLLKPGGLAVIDADAPGAGEIVALCERHGTDVMTIGEMGRYLRVKSIVNDGFSQVISVVHHRGASDIRLPLVGGFQASNALVAAALVAAGGVPLLDILAQLETLVGAKGRLELVGKKHFEGGLSDVPGASDAPDAPVFVDYAHTPDALETAIEALLPYKTGRLIVVFGCGGDRDKGKRAMMGEIAARLSDVVIVTDDNPRGEEAGAIRAQILNAAPEAQEIADRSQAIVAGVDELKAGDVLLVAGKGHETGQIVVDQVLPFSDHEAVAEALAKYE